MKRQISIRIDDAVYALLQQEAEQNERRVSSQIRIILRGYAESLRHLPAPEKKPACAYCRYFCQHYEKDPFGWFSPVPFGHCEKPHPKFRRSGSIPCDSFNEK